MLAMAAEVHVVSAKYCVPSVVDSWSPSSSASHRRVPGEPGGQGRRGQEDARDYGEGEGQRQEAGRGRADILNTLGDAVVGGSSQAVAAPTNARIGHELVQNKGKIQRIAVELYPELFARRSINIPGVLMGAVYGASTSDYEM